MQGNLWQLFKQLTDGEAKQLATVVSRSGTNYTVQMAGGNMVDVVGQGAFEIDSKVFIKGGQIVGQAPDLTYFEMEV